MAFPRPMPIFCLSPSTYSHERRSSWIKTTNTTNAKDRLYDEKERLADNAAKAENSMKDKGATMKERMSDAANSAKDKVMRAAHDARDSARETAHKAERAMHNKFN